MAMVAAWIWSDNLRPFLATLSWFAGYEFDGSDWAAIRSGVADTDDEADRWFSYEFGGRRKVTFRLARDQESSVIHVRVWSDAEGELMIDAAVAIFSHFRVRDDLGRDDSLTDDLLASNPSFRGLVAKTKASPRRPLSAD